jgi:hypothetical protein
MSCRECRTSAHWRAKSRQDCDVDWTRVLKSLRRQFTEFSEIKKMQFSVFSSQFPVRNELINTFSLWRGVSVVK